MSSFNENDKVFESKDAGRYMDKYFRNTITKFTRKLYRLSIIRKGDLYIGTDIGVFHKDSTMTEWQLFNNGLHM